MKDLLINRTADFSPCRTWRYTLIREWNAKLPSLLMVLLNPSTADEQQDDPTNRRGINYAIDWGFGSLCFCNLFAFRTPQPKEMMAAKDPIGPNNDWWIRHRAAMSDKIVLGWGNDGSFNDRSRDVLLLLRGFELYCLDKNKNGEPKHPLYCRGDLKPKRYLEAGPPIVNDA